MQIWPSHVSAKNIQGLPNNLRINFKIYKDFVILSMPRSLPSILPLSPWLPMLQSHWPCYSSEYTPASGSSHSLFLCIKHSSLWYHRACCLTSVRSPFICHPSREVSGTTLTKLFISADWSNLLPSPSIQWGQHFLAFLFLNELIPRT